MRETPIQLGQRWLDQAIDDLKWAQFLAAEGGYPISCFLSQQVAEKAIKAFLYAQGEEIVVGYSVSRLCKKAAEFEPSFADKSQRWSILDGFYIPARYPMAYQIAYQQRCTQKTPFPRRLN